ncbi:hypothetical protein EGM_20302, partial [Macaca fascicularis]
AWRKRWFILRRGQTSSDPDVLEYYKNDGSKNPLRTINLNLCEQLDVGVTLNFNKKEIQKGYMFDIKTSERTFYLVAETREDMNEWVQSICQICGFRQVEESTGSLGNISSASHGPCSSAAEPSRSHQHLPQERERASEPPVSHHVPPIWPILAPRGCLCPHQHASQKAGHVRSASFSQGSRAPFPMRRSTAVQNLAQHSECSVDGVSGHIHGFHSLSKPSQHNTEFRGSTCRTPWSLASHGHTRGSLTGSEADNEGVYPFKAPRSTLCQEFGGHLVNNSGVPAIPLSAHQIPRTVTLDKNLCATAMATPGPIGSLPLPKASQAEACQWGSPQQRPSVSESSRWSIDAAIPRRNTLPAIDNSRCCQSHTFYSSSSQYPISMQSITSTDSEDIGEREIFLQNAASAFPVSGGTSSSALPRSTGTIHYVALDFQPSKPRPHRLSSIGSVTSGEKVDYVQVDLEKTWALQKTMHEQMCLRQSLEPPRGAKL